jgi:hypothetical protein
MSYVKFEKLSLKSHAEFNERRVQDRTAEDFGNSRVFGRYLGAG